MKNKKGFELSFLGKLILLLILLLVILGWLALKYKPQIFGSINIFDIW